MQTLSSMLNDLRHSNMSLRTIESSIFAIFGDGHNPKVGAMVTDAARKEYSHLINARNKAMHGEDVQKSLDGVIRMHHVAKGVVHAAIGCAVRGGRQCV